MSVAQIIGVLIGIVIIVAVIWNVRGHRRRGDGTIPEREDAWMTNDWPGGPA
jgi:hypothetical protein